MAGLARCQPEHGPIHREEILGTSLQIAIGKARDTLPDQAGRWSDDSPGSGQKSGCQDEGLAVLGVENIALGQRPHGESKGLESRRMPGHDGSHAVSQKFAESRDAPAPQDMLVKIADREGFGRGVASGDEGDIDGGAERDGGGEIQKGLEGRRVGARLVVGPT